jgi:hypothetical protein
MLENSSGCSVERSLDLPTGHIVDDSNDWAEEMHISGETMDLQFHSIRIVHEEARNCRESTRIDLHKIGVLSFYLACVAFSMSTTWRMFRESHVIAKVWGPRLRPPRGGTHAYTSLRGGSILTNTSIPLLWFIIRCFGQHRHCGTHNILTSESWN